MYKALVTAPIYTKLKGGVHSAALACVSYDAQ